MLKSIINPALHAHLRGNPLKLQKSEFFPLSTPMQMDISAYNIVYPWVLSLVFLFSQKLKVIPHEHTFKISKSKFGKLFGSICNRTPKMSQIKTFPLNSRTKTTALKQPKELISYSRKIDESIVIDDSCLSYYYFPDTEVDKNYDLTAGFKKFKQIEDKGSMDGFLKAISTYEKQQNAKVKTDIVSFRGLMRKILTLHYSPDEVFDLNVVHFDGQIFVKSNYLSDVQRNKAELSTREAQGVDKDAQDKFTYTGYKFETLATLDKPWADASRKDIESREKAEVNNIEQYLSVVKTGIGNTKLLLGGEVDCVFDYKPDPNDKFSGKDSVVSHYVELKTSKVINTQGQAITFEKKLFKTWAQCFLLGIPKIIYAFRDDAMHLKTVEEFKTEEVPLILKNSPIQRHSNNPKVRKINCVDSLKWFGAVLEWLMDVVPKDDASDLDAQLRNIFRLSYNGALLSFTELSDEERDRIVADEPVVTKEFVEWRKQLRKTGVDKE